MAIDPERQVVEPSAEDLQDYYLVAESRAAKAKAYLAEMVEERRQQAENVVNHIASLANALRSSDERRIDLEDEVRRLTLALADSDRRLRAVQSDYARLQEGHATLVRDIEETQAANLTAYKRIDAMLVHNEYGGGRQGQHIPPSRKATEFHHAVFHTLPPDAHAPPGYGAQPAYNNGYGPDSFSLRQSFSRNER